MNYTCAIYSPNMDHNVQYEMCSLEIVFGNFRNTVVLNENNPQCVKPTKFLTLWSVDS